MTEQLPLFPLRTVDGIFIDKSGRDIQYIGKVQEQSDGTWRCLANINGMLCLVQVTEPVYANK